MLDDVIRVARAIEAVYEIDIILWQREAQAALAQRQLAQQHLFIGVAVERRCFQMNVGDKLSLGVLGIAGCGRRRADHVGLCQGYRAQIGSFEVVSLPGGAEQGGSD